MKRHVAPDTPGMPHRTPTRAKHWLIWCLIALLPWLGLGVAQRQQLGPLHVHAAPESAGARPSTASLQRALDWWWTQVQAQNQARKLAHAHARAHAQGQMHAHAHAHNAWQRHHHAPHDASVVALDKSGDEPGTLAAAASLLLPALGAPAAGLRIAASVAEQRRWPTAGAARFSSWGMAPPLRPPRG